MKYLYLFFFLLCLPAKAYCLSVDAVVTSRWLQENIHNHDLKIIEMSDEASYNFDGHIPGAVFTNKSDWRYQASDGALVHFDASRLESMVQDMGINDTDAVVIYYKGSNLNEVLGSHYLFWLFHYLGHTNVAMLNKGWHGWLEAGGSIDEQAAPLEDGNFISRALTSLELATDELYAIRNHYTVIDGRPASHFAGETKFPANTRYGRIPGSLSQPWESYLQRDDQGRLYVDMYLLPPILEHGMIDKQQPLLLTCFGGTGAAVNYAFFYSHGYRNMRLHDAGLRRWNERRLPLVRDIP